MLRIHCYFKMQTFFYRYLKFKHSSDEYVSYIFGLKTKMNSKTHPIQVQELACQEVHFDVPTSTKLKLEPMARCRSCSSLEATETQNDDNL